jgi:hypothetical protein
MKGKQKACTNWFFFTAAILSFCSLMLGCKQAPAAAAIPGAKLMAKADDPATRELRAIGDRVAVAVLARDVKTLLEFDHDPDDQASLTNKSGDLYCYLFDTSCITGANRRAVYDLFSTSPHLGIDATVATVQGRNYGLLMFYDKSQISDAELYSPDLLCSDKGLKGTATWRFILANGKWNTSTLFEYKTQRECKNSNQRLAFSHPGNSQPLGLQQPNGTRSLNGDSLITGFPARTFLRVFI